MKVRLFVSILILVGSELVMTQSITFDKSLPFQSGKCVHQTADSGFIIAASNGYDYSSGFSVIKTDKYGYIEWYKNFLDLFSNSSSSVIQTSDGGYAAVCTIVNRNPTDYNIYLIKFNQVGEVEWTKEFGEPDRTDNGCSIVQTIDNGYLVAGTRYNATSSYKPIFYRTDYAGDLLSVTQSSYSSDPIPLNLVESPDSTFLFTYSRLLAKIDSYGNEIWDKLISGLIIQALYINPGKIALLKSKNIMILDSEGNIIHDNILPVTHTYSLSKKPDGNILILAITNNPFAFNIFTVDTVGQILSQTPIWASGYYIQSTSDGGFILTGANIPNYSGLSLWLYKSNLQDNFSSINIIAPIDNSIIQSFDNYRLEWHTQNVDYVDIQYSTDGGSNWNTIINFYPAQLDTVSWSVPEYYSTDALIRIRNTYDHETFDISDPPVKIITYKSIDYISSNEIFMWMGNNGMNAHDPINDASGFYWPGGENAVLSAIFSDGLLWGGKVNGEIRVNGATYRQGLTPGYILPSGLPSDPYEIKSKIFKLKKDWQYLPPSAERSRYEYDYINWPVDIGAPWDDNNDDGVYTLGIDEPKIFGDETLFFVANDLDTLRSLYTYGSNPVGLEFQVTTFGYNNELLRDVVFKKFKIINKSPNSITDMYLTYWSDDDLGLAVDDYVGCDTLLNLAYTYNGDNNDEGYYGTPPPAVGHLIVQPPIISAEPTDSAHYGGGWKQGFKNISINSFMLFIGGSSTYMDPSMGVYEGTLQLYNYMQGLLWNGDPIIDPNTNLPTHFCLSGDPVTGTGWYEGNGWPGGPVSDDRRFLLTTGKFNMAPNDTQEVVIAFLIKKGTDNINSITELKNYAAQIQHWYDNDFVTDVNETNPSIPIEFSLSQNFPNPFNPSTTIKYATSSRQFVTLKVYDVLGNELSTLVDEEKSAGNYEVEFKSAVGSFQLASGVYFYRLQAGSFISTKKMLLIK
jgi:hypothetical protein